MKILDLGCGKNKFEGAIGIDFCKDTKADIVHDVNVFPYPFEDDTFDKVIMNHIIEHLDNIVRVMEEVHRISKPDAEVYIKKPHFSCRDSWRNPTHKHHLAIDSFDYFTDNPMLTTYYTKARFKIVKKEITFSNSLLSVIPRLLYKISKNKCEKHFAFMFPANNLLFELRVSK
ncbi:MAG: methyltransferase domain-containing protein [Candidatus Aenigmatarchaeota archaeon]